MYHDWILGRYHDLFITNSLLICHTRTCYSFQGNGTTLWHTKGISNHVTWNLSYKYGRPGDLSAKSLSGVLGNK